MFTFDRNKIPEQYEVFLCRPDKTVICALNGIDEESAHIKINLNNQYDFSFTYHRYINDSDGNRIEANGYHFLNVGQYIYVRGIGFFKMQYPPFEFNGEIETKQVQAYSIDCELEVKKLFGFKVNTGEQDSLEYLVQYNEDETEPLINAYTNLPYDYILFYDTRAAQLGEILNKYSDDTTITDADSIAEIDKICKLIPRLVSIVTVETVDDFPVQTLTEYVIYTYDTDGTTILSLELKNFNERISQLITFYNNYQSQLSLLNLAIEKCKCNWTIGDIDESLINKKFQFDVDGQNIYSFLTQDIATTCKCIVDFDITNRKINIVSVDNIGQYTGISISRRNFLDNFNVTCDDNSVATRFRVSGADDLGIEFVNFGDSIIDDISYFLHSKTVDDDNTYVGDSLVQKYTQFAADREILREKYIALTKEYNDYYSKIYELKYKVPNDFMSTDYSQYTEEELEGLMQTYEKMLAVLISLYKEDYGTNGLNPDESVDENKIKYTEYWGDYYAYKQIMDQIEAAYDAIENGSTYKKINDPDVLAEINAWKTQWDLYGSIELQNKIDTYENSMKALVESGAVFIVDELTDDTPIPWNELSSEQQAEFGMQMNYQYDVYNDILQNRNGAKTYLATVLAQIETLETAQELVGAQREVIVKHVHVEDYDRDILEDTFDDLSDRLVEDSTFTESEIETIHRLYIDTEYSNENILTTSLDTEVTKVDVERELLEDAVKQLSITSQPQIVCTASMKNLLALPEFEELSKQFKLGNYILVEYFDDYYIRMRITAIEFNPRNPTDEISVEFSNYIKSNVDINDAASLLGDTGNGGVSNVSASSGGGGGDGTLGDNIDFTLSNTMLSKLVKSELFGTAVTNVVLDTMNLNKLTAKYATFGGLANGTTTIDGDSLKTGSIHSNAVNPTTLNPISSFNLDDGTFNYGDGALVFDGEDLYITGDITATTGHIGGWEIGDNYLRSVVSEKTTALNSSGTWLIVAGATGTNYSSAPFRVDSDGNVYATSADISGTINANSGSLGNYTISDGKLYTNGHSAWNTNVDGVYIGSDYISLGKLGKAYIKNDGTVNFVSGTIGGWKLDSVTLSSRDETEGLTTGLQVPSSGQIAFTVGATNPSQWNTGAFYVKHNGDAYSKSLTVDGFFECTFLIYKNNAVTPNILYDAFFGNSGDRSLRVGIGKHNSGSIVFSSFSGLEVTYDGNVYLSGSYSYLTFDQINVTSHNNINIDFLSSTNPYIQITGYAPTHVAIEGNVSGSTGAGAYYSVKVPNHSGSLNVTASGTFGLYSSTKSEWLINVNNSDSLVHLPLNATVKGTKLLYEIGDTETFRGHVGGSLTSSTKNIIFIIPMNKRRVSSNTPSIGISDLSVRVRHVGGGYLIGSATALASVRTGGRNISPYTVTTSTTGGNLVVTIERDTAYSATNNTPVSVEFECLIKMG